MLSLMKSCLLTQLILWEKCSHCHLWLPPPVPPTHCLYLLKGSTQSQDLLLKWQLHVYLFFLSIFFSLHFFIFSALEELSLLLFIFEKRFCFCSVLVKLRGSQGGWSSTCFHVSDVIQLVFSGFRPWIVQKNILHILGRGYKGVLWCFLLHFERKHCLFQICGSEKNWVALKRTVLLHVSSFQLLIILAFAFCLKLVVNCVFWIFCFFFFFLLFPPDCFIFCTVKSISDTTGFEGFGNRLFWDLIPCSIDPSQHHLIAGRPFLSRRRVSELAFHHRSFILRMDLFALHRLLMHLSRGCKTGVSPRGITATLTFLLERRSFTSSVKWLWKESHTI